MTPPPSPAVRKTVWQFTLRRALIAVTFVGIWLANNLETARERRGWMRRLEHSPSAASLCLTHCSDSLGERKANSDIPLAWRLCGATPLSSIHLDGNEYSQLEACELAMLFPEAEIVRSRGTQSTDSLQFHYQPYRSRIARANSLFAWWWKTWWIAQW
jgi:hypothetical protein